MKVKENESSTNFDVIDELIQKIDWNKALLPRHHKFIRAYLKYRSIYLVADRMGYPLADMFNIFARIQHQLIDAAKIQDVQTEHSLNYTIHHMTKHEDRLEELIELIRSTDEEVIEQLNRVQINMFRDIRGGMSYYHARLKNHIAQDVADEQLFGDEDSLYMKLKNFKPSFSVPEVDSLFEQSIESRVATLISFVKAAERKGIKIDKVLTPRQLEIIQYINKNNDLEHVANELGLQRKTLYEYLWARTKPSVFNKIASAFNAG